MHPFIDRFFRQLPVIFPLVALFHIALLGYTVYSFASQGVLNTFIGGGTCLVLAVYAVLWTIVCDVRRIAAIGYLIFTSINLLLHFCTPRYSEWRLVADSLFPFDVLMCFFLLFYYKRFQ